MVVADGAKGATIGNPWLIEEDKVKRPSARILALAKPELKSLIWGTLALTIGAAMTLMYPMVIQNMIDGIDNGGGRELVNKGAVILLCLFGAGAVMGALRAWLFTVAGERIVANLRTQLYTAIISQEIGFSTPAVQGS